MYRKMIWYDCLWDNIHHSSNAVNASYHRQPYTFNGEKTPYYMFGIIYNKTIYEKQKWQKEPTTVTDLQDLYVGQKHKNVEGLNMFVSYDNYIPGTIVLQHTLEQSVKICWKGLNSSNWYIEEKHPTVQAWQGFYAYFTKTTTPNTDLSVFVVTEEHRENQ